MNDTSKEQQLEAMDLWMTAVTERLDNPDRKTMHIDRTMVRHAYEEWRKSVGHPVTDLCEEGTK